MRGRRGSTTDSLATRHARWLRWLARRRIVLSAERLRELERLLTRLRSKGIATVPQLLKRFRSLSPKLRMSAARDVIGRFKIHQAWPLLLERLPDPLVRVSYADLLSRLNTGGRATAYFVEVGRRELASSEPDRRWLEAVIFGLCGSSDRGAVELLVKIFERTDLPDWVRGEAGDKLGVCNLVHDRRTKLYRRCRAAALQGVNEDSTEVCFWSMYVIGSLTNEFRSDWRIRARDFQAALPRLRQIAKSDHRLAPGFWWPMSGEAADVIHCIKTGGWPSREAAERFPSTGQRGRPSARD
jgi:hypothetical protein